MSNNEADRLAAQIKFNIGWNNHKLACAGVDQLAALAKQQAPEATAEQVPSEMPLPIALRLLARQIKEGDGLRDNRERKHILLERAAVSIEAQATAEPAAVPVGWKLLKDTTHAERSWPEANNKEGTAFGEGIYQSACGECLRNFLGWKRRGICAHCAALAVQSTQKAEEGVACTHHETRCSTYVECAASGCKRATPPKAEATQAAAGGDAMSTRKANWLAEGGHKFTGFVMHKPGDRTAIIDGGAVRWLTDAELWTLMHVEGSTVVTPPSPAQSPEQPAQAEPMSDERIAKIARAFSDRISEACGVDPIDHWTHYSDEAKADVLFVLAEAGIKGKP